MKLLRVRIISAPTCGGLLDGMDIYFNQLTEKKINSGFSPICFIGPNGSGKSQLLQAVAEIFQSIFHEYLPSEERIESNSELLFELEYWINDQNGKKRHIRISRKEKRNKINIEEKINTTWSDFSNDTISIESVLPQKIIGYTSGDNETLSLPFLVSRAGYAEEVRENALSELKLGKKIPDTRLLLIDYSTNLEVLVANLLLGNQKQRENLLKESNLKDIYSFRCIIQLAHSAVRSKGSSKKEREKSNRKGILLTNELEKYIKFMKKCSTCYKYSEKDEKYIFDIFINDEIRKAFRFYWKDPLNLYSSFHKLSMLNDLAIKKITRDRFKRDTKTRRFASRLPEPQDEEKVFRFERVEFLSIDSNSTVDYVSLSDGEHQLAQLLGILSMVSSSNVLFLLDEAESHFNPQWRVKFVSRLYNTPTLNGLRGDNTSAVCQQECLMTTHAPFVPSDMDRERVLIFNKTEHGIEVRHPNIQTYGSTFDDILGDCFDVRPPISALSKDKLKNLCECKDPEVIRAKIDELGDSVEKLLLVDHLRQLEKKE